jgi:hypothetical protein
MSHMSIDLYEESTKDRWIRVAAIDIMIIGGNSNICVSKVCQTSGHRCPRAMDDPTDSQNGVDLEFEMESVSIFVHSR